MPLQLSLLLPLRLLQRKELTYPMFFVLNNKVPKGFFGALFKVICGGFPVIKVNKRNFYLKS